MFFQVDDQFFTNPKAKALAERAMTGDVTGVAAIGLWTMAGSQTQASLTDGLVSMADAIRVLLNPKVAQDLADHLVDVGLWHGPGHRCQRCEPVPEGFWRYHDWFDLRYDTGEQVKETRRRRQELKDRSVTDAVWARDCTDPANPNVAKCRYCGITVKKKDTRSEATPTLDHVNPAVARGVRNLVVACRPCNQKKGQRTPAQAGMTLRKPPRETRDDPTQVLTEAPATPSEVIAVNGDQRTSGEVIAVQDDQRTSREEIAVSDQRTSQQPEVIAVNDDQRTSRRGNAGAEAADTAGMGPPPDQKPDQNSPNLVHGVLGRVRGGARAMAGSGQGGVSSGVGEGSASGSQSGSRRSRRGRASSPPGPPRSSTQAQPAPDSQAEGESWDAGVAPVVQAPPGRFGSPWHGWSGPPPDDSAESTCPEHELPEPCWRCRDAFDAAEAVGGGRRG